MVWVTLFLVVFLFYPKKYSEAKTMSMSSSIVILKSYFQETCLESTIFFIDSMSMSMICLSLLISCMTITIYSFSSSLQKPIFCFTSGIIALVLFMVNNLMVFFIMFELSLIPLSIMILGWGKQPERVLASKYMIFFTLFSSFPFMCFMVFSDETHSLSSMNNPLITSDYSLEKILSETSSIIFLLVILVFLMKTPIFSLHSWLPKAHVEAPLEGSMILAGIMLKVGTYGIIRMMYLFPSKFMTETLMIIFPICLIGSIYSVIMAISSDDLKMSIALSSVSHMNFMMCSLCSMKELSIKSSISMMISHGLSSSILFFLVTIVYEMNNSRSFLISKGSMSNFPSMNLFSIIFFSLSIGIPPSLPFLSEMMIISCTWSFSIEILTIVCLYIISNSFYSMMLFGLMNHSSNFKPLKPFKTILLFNFFGLICSFFLVISFFFSESIF